MSDSPGGLIRTAPDIDSPFLDALLAAHEDGYRAPSFSDDYPAGLDLSGGDQDA